MSTARRLGRPAAVLVSLAVVAAMLVTAPPSAAAITEVTATAAVNVRSSPSTSARIVGGLYRGQEVAALSSSNGWTTIEFAGGTGYVASRYLTTDRLDAPATVTGKRITTTPTNLRRGAGLSYDILRVVGEGIWVQLTGRSARGFVEIVIDGDLGWISTRYLAPSTSGLPATAGTWYAVADLNLWRAPTRSGHPDEIPRGTAVEITGAESNGLAQIVYSNTVRWVTATYLSPVEPESDMLRPSDLAGGIPASWTVTERKLTAKTISVHRAVRKAFPEIQTVGGQYRSNAGEHPVGRAIDIMIPNYRSASGRELGNKIAAWAKQNAGSLNVMYVVWRRHIWNVERDREGWRYMSDRGDDSSNHINHVHISVLA